MLTFVVFLASLVLVRLGFWQISRYYERQRSNHQYLTQFTAQNMHIDKSGDLPKENLDYRHATVSGIPLPSHAIVRINQYHESELGYNLLVPFKLADESLIFVDLGWIPKNGNEDPKDWQKFIEPKPLVVTGILRQSRSVPKPSTPGYYVDFDSAQLQSLEGGKVVPFFLQALPGDGYEGKNNTPPIMSFTPVEITDGPHIGYAVQWFAFAVLLLGGYPFFLRSREKLLNIVEDQEV